MGQYASRHLGIALDCAAVGADGWLFGAWIRRERRKLLARVFLSLMVGGGARSCTNQIIATVQNTTV